MSLLRTVSLALVLAATQAVLLKQEDGQEPASAEMSLAADLQLPLRVSLGQAKFRARACSQAPLAEEEKSVTQEESEAAAEEEIVNDFAEETLATEE